VQTISYATAVAPKVVDIRAYSADLFLDAVTVPAANPADIQTFCYYDKQGRKAGEVNGEGYLTEYGYDANGRLAQTTRYANKARTPVTATASLDALTKTMLSEMPGTNWASLSARPTSMAASPATHTTASAR
jgi:YD repeat-containing protein